MKMPFRLKIAPFLIAGAALALVHCGEDEAGPKSCQEIGDDATRSAQNQDEPVFKVLSPNGGEHWRVGDSVTVRIGANSKGNSALVYLMVRRQGATRRLRLPGTPAGHDVNPRTDCALSFVVPAAITEGGVAYPVVSDTVKVRVAAYNAETLYSDESDAPFGISE